MPVRPASNVLRTLASVTALLALAAACNQPSDDAQAREFSSAKKREPARVLVQPLERREMVRRLETTTRVESESQVQVFPRAAGVVVELFVEEGQSVAADEVLARLDDRDVLLRLKDARSSLNEARANGPKLALATRESQARVESAQGAAQQAERDHERNVALSKGGPDAPGLVSGRDLDTSLATRDRARADFGAALLALERAKVEEQNGEHAVARAEVAVARLELELTFTSIRAPVAGVVAERSIKLGDTVSNAAAAFTLTDLARLRAVFFRPQREFELFVGALGTAGDSAARAEATLTATAEALPGKRFVGHIQRVAPTIDPASGNFRVTARLESELQPGVAGLLPGMLVRLEIITERRPNALVAPKRAIKREGDRSTLQLVVNGVAKTVEVSEGFSDEAWVEVAARRGEALEAGALVIVVGNRDLEDGAEVLASDDTGAALGATTPDGSK